MNCVLCWENKKGGNHPLLVPKTGYRQVTMQHKQARIVHAIGRELSRLLALVFRILAVFI